MCAISIAMYINGNDYKVNLMMQAISNEIYFKLYNICYA